MTETRLADNAAITDRRESPRHRAILGAQIIYRDGHCSMGCVILNYSDHGALVRLSDIAACPENFELKPRFDPPRTCELAWQHGQIVGVHYV
jgi:hypothetical protein